MTLGLMLALQLLSRYSPPQACMSVTVTPPAIYEVVVGTDDPIYTTKAGEAGFIIPPGTYEVRVGNVTQFVTTVAQKCSTVRLDTQLQPLPEVELPTLTSHPFQLTGLPGYDRNIQ